MPILNLVPNLDQEELVQLWLGQVPVMDARLVSGWSYALQCIGRGVLLEGWYGRRLKEQLRGLKDAAATVLQVPVSVVRLLICCHCIGMEVQLW